MDALLDAIVHLGWIAIAAVIFAESGLLIGFFLPGDSLLFTAGFLTQQGILPLNIHVLVFILFIAAAAGDSVGYSFGHKVGRRLFKRPDSRFFHQENLRRAEEFYERYGAKTIIIARFVPFVRTFAPIVAGIGKMHYSQFIIYNLIGGFLWAVGLTYLGYYAGEWIESIGINLEVAIIGIVALSLLPAVYHVLKEPAGRDQIKKTLVSFRRRFFKK